MNLILACVDYSPVTEMVLNTAAKLAQATKARLILAHVVIAPLPIAYDELAGVADCAALVRQVKHETMHRVEQTCTRLREQYGLTVLPLILEGTQAATALLSEALRLEPDIIVVGSHGYGPLGRLVMGSTCQQLVRKGRWPVLVIPSAQAVAAAAAQHADPAHHQEPMAAH